jgi:hypothetical protein
MTINYTTLLGLAKPVTGTESGAWGDVVNTQITSLLEDAVSNTASVSVTAGNVTLTSTAGTANEARCAIVIATGTPGVSRNIVAPSQSKFYIVINQSDDAVVFKGSATTGVTIASGTTVLLAWNGSDFELIGESGDVVGPSNSVDNEIALFSGTSGKIVKRASTTGILKATSGVIAAAAAGTDYLAPADIGVTVQAYDADTAKTDVLQTFTASQRGTVTVDNDGSFDLNVTNNFICTPTGTFALTFTNITAGQSGNILLVNGSNYAITAATATKVGLATLGTISATGTYWLSYYSPDGTNVYVVNSGSLL